MRFNDWDVLLFPQTSSTPIQEFRTECFNIATPLGITPTINTYIPSLPYGTPFKISLHSWSKPALSPSSNRRIEQIVLAMHVAVDGKPVAIETLNPDGNFPHEVHNSAMHRMLFPPFRTAMCQQPRLHIADNLGRITVSLSEGFFYQQVDTGKLCFRPVKDIVTFKWMHAPLRLLGSAGVSWPNPQLFTRPEDSLGYDQIPPMFYPVDHQSISSQDSGLSLPHSISVVPARPVSYPPSVAPFQALDQTLIASDSLDPSDLTASSELSSAYTFAPLSDSIHAPSSDGVAQQSSTTRISSEQVREIASAIVPELIGHGISMMDGAADIKQLLHPLREDVMRKVSDISMHTACDQYPECVFDTPDGKDVTHSPRRIIATPSKVPRGRKRLSKLSPGKNISYRFAHKISKPMQMHYTMVPEAELSRLSLD